MSAAPLRPVVVLVALVLFAPAARAQKKDVRKVYEEATAAFGLGRYPEAAEKYEQAFSLKPDPAFLYNAAQSYRLGGNKARALELYRNCLRLYPNFANADDARNHVATLKKQLDDEHAAATAPPPPGAPARPPAAVPPPAVMPPPALTPAPAPSAPALPPPTPTAPSPPTAAMPPPVLTQPAPPPASGPTTLGTDTSVPTIAQTPGGPAEEKSITSQPWFWIAVGAAVVAAGAITIALATRGEKFPDPTFGTVPGN
jgi:hypothetical protein